MAPSADRALILVGRVLRAHGVRGELKILPETDEPERLKELDRLFFGNDERTAVPQDALSVRFQRHRKGILALVELKGVTGREEAEAFRNALVYASEADLPELGDDEFYWHTLVGCIVRTEAEAIGEVRDVLDMPAQHILLVARDGKPDAMIPVVDEFIEDIDVDARQIVVRPIEGLLDD